MSKTQLDTDLIVLATGNLQFTGLGQRITGDFSNATQSSRVLFQTSTANGVTNLGALPNGTATTSSFTAFSSSDNTNNGYAQLRIDGTTAQIRSGVNGTGTLLPLVAQVGGVEVMRWDTAYNVGIGVSPYTWLNYRALDIGSAGALVAWTAGTKNIGLYSNVNYDGAWKYKQTGAAARIDLDDGTFKVNVATSGTAGATVSSWVQALTLDNSGNLSLAYGSGNRIAISTDQSIASTKTDLSSYTPLYLDGSKVSIRTGTGSVSEKAQVDANGNFGLGTTPSAHTTGSNTKVVQLSDATVVAGDINTTYLGSNFYFTNVAPYAKRIKAGYATRYYSSHYDGTHVWSVAGTAALGTDVAFTDAMKLDNSGNFKVGEYSASNHIFRKDVAATTLSIWNGNGTSPEGLNIYLGGLNNVATGKFIRCNDSVGERFNVLSNGNVQNANNSYGAISDIKLKENIVDATPKLDKLMQVRIVNYNLKTDPDHKQLGVIAQEVEQVFPGIVEETPDFETVTKTREVEVPAVLDEEGNEVEPATIKTEEYTEQVATGEVTKAVKYSVFVPMLIKAMQEQQAIIAKLTRRIEQLEAR